MRQKMKGILKQWNEERGYGFIQPLGSEESIFAHISKFDKTHKRPQVGDKLIFGTTEGSDGKKQAVTITGVGGVSSVRSARHNNQIYRPDLKQKTSRSSRRYLILSALGIFLFLRYLTSGNQTTTLNTQPIEEPQSITPPTIVSVSDSMPQYPKQENPYTNHPTPRVDTRIDHTTITDVKRVTPNATPTQSKSNREYRCDGRQYCSQMRSCEEAIYFLNNCPNTKMDGGDGRRSDGVPCESQWCH